MVTSLSDWSFDTQIKVYMLAFSTAFNLITCSSSVDRVWTISSVKNKLSCLLIRGLISTGENKKENLSITFHCDLVLPGVWVSENLHMDGHLSHGIVHPSTWQDRQRVRGTLMPLNLKTLDSSMLLSQTKHSHKPLCTLFQILPLLVKGYRPILFQFYKLKIEMDLALTFWISHKANTS